MIFKELEAEGFGSIINRTKFPLDRNCLTIMRGPVGAGKTSIPSILYWVLYGQTLKKGSTVETWKELQPEDFKGTMGKVTFIKKGSKYEIFRCISYKGVIYGKKRGGSGIHILKDGDSLEVKGKKSQNQVITDILGYSPDLFINSIIYGQRLKRIIEESGPNKKKIFDEAFETLFIDKAKGVVDSERKELISVISLKEVELEKYQKEEADLTSMINDLLSNEKNFKSDKKAKLNEILEEKAKLEKTLKKTKKKLSKIPNSDKSELQEEFVKLEHLLDKYIEESDNYDLLKTNISSASDLIDHNLELIKSLKLKICNECGGIMSKDKIEAKKKKLKQEIENQQTVIEVSSKELSKIDMKSMKDEYNKLFNRKEELLRSIYQVKSNKALKKELESNKADLEKRINKCESKYLEVRVSKQIIKSKKYQSKLGKATKQRELIEGKLKKLNKELEIKTWLIKEPLSNTGIKAYIFNSLLKEVNNRLSDYGEILGFNIEFGIDMETSSKDFYQVIYKDDIIINYPDLSGGQKQLVDTSVALAIHDVISSVRPTNILFLDEPFEGLDNDCIELVSDIINYKAREQSVYLITHHNSFNPTNAETVYFTLDPAKGTIIN